VVLAPRSLTLPVPVSPRIVTFDMLNEVVPDAMAPSAANPPEILADQVVAALRKAGKIDKPSAST